MKTNPLLYFVLALLVCFSAEAQPTNNSSVRMDRFGTFLSNYNPQSTNPFTFGANPANLQAVVSATASSVAAGTNGIQVVTNGTVYTISYTGSGGGVGGAPVLAGTNIWVSFDGTNYTVSGPPLPPSTNGLATVAYVLTASNNVYTLSVNYTLGASNSLYSLTLSSTNLANLSPILTNLYAGRAEMQAFAESLTNGFASVSYVQAYSLTTSNALVSLLQSATNLTTLSGMLTNLYAGRFEMNANITAASNAVVNLFPLAVQSTGMTIVSNFSGGRITYTFSSSGGGGVWPAFDTTQISTNASSQVAILSGAALTNASILTITNRGGDYRGVVVKNGTYTAGQTDNVIRETATTNTSINLPYAPPSGSPAGQRLTIFNAGSAVSTLQPGNSNTVASLTSLALPPLTSASLYCAPGYTNWDLLALGTNSIPGGGGGGSSTTNYGALYVTNVITLGGTTISNWSEADVFNRGISYSWIFGGGVNGYTPGNYSGEQGQGTGSGATYSFVATTATTIGYKKLTTGATSGNNFIDYDAAYNYGTATPGIIVAIFKLETLANIRFLFGVGVNASQLTGTPGSVTQIIAAGYDSAVSGNWIALPYGGAITTTSTAADTNWHTAVIYTTGTSLTLILDGVNLGTTTFSSLSNTYTFACGIYAEANTSVSVDLRYMRNTQLY